MEDRRRILKPALNLVWAKLDTLGDEEADHLLKQLVTNGHFGVLLGGFVQARPVILIHGDQKNLRLW